MLKKVKDYIRNGVLPGTDILHEEVDVASLHIPEELAVMTRDSAMLLQQKHKVDWVQLDRLRSHADRGRKTGYSHYVQYFSLPDIDTPLTTTKQAPFNVLFSYLDGSAKHKVEDFVQHFTQRFNILEKILHVRPELQNSISISRVLKKQEREPVCIIGMVMDKVESKNGNLMLTVEDKTGFIKVLISKSKPELFEQARDIVFDEVIGIDGVCGNRIVFVNNIFWPDVPFNKELKKTEEEVYAVFLSDIHVGSTYFLHKEFGRFLKWISGQSGNESQKAIVDKIQYVVIAGDIIDGVGIYPGQDKELSIQDIYQQYEECARLLQKIPSHIHVIVCAGNHDALRLSEPQPPLDKDFAKSIYALPNVTVVSNPSLVTLHAHDPSGGVDVMLYHGYSFDYYVANVDSIRNKGGYRRADLIMKFLLKRRHLAPTLNSALRIPDTQTDPLAITKIPDILVTGHIHYSLVGNYRNITLISGSCWQSATDFQRKMGHTPEPGRAPVINLKTREVKILKFID